MAGGWWWHSSLLQAPTVSADPHRILNLPLSADPANPPFPNLPRVEYTWAPGSLHLAVATQDQVFLVNVKTGQIVWQRARSFEGASDSVFLVHWSTDGKQMQMVPEGGIPGAGQIAWPAPAQAYIPAGSPIEWKGTFSPDQTYLASTRPNQDTEVEIWNIPEKRLVAQCQNAKTVFYPPGDAFDLAWSPESTSLAVYTSRKQPTIQLWRAEDGHLLWTADIAYPGDQQLAEPGVQCMKWSADGQALAYAYVSDRPLLGVLDAQTGATRFQTPMALSFLDTIGEAFAWSPDGTRLAFFANEGSEPVLQVWQALTGQHLFTCQRVPGLIGLAPTGESNLFSGEPGIVSWSPDGRYLVARTLPEDKSALATLQFWDAHTGKALFSYHAPYEDDFLIWSPKLLWSPDSHFLAAYMVTRADCSVPGGIPGHPSCSYTYALQVFQIG